MLNVGMDEPWFYKEKPAPAKGRFQGEVGESRQQADP